MYIQVEELIQASIFCFTVLVTALAEEFANDDGNSSSATN